MEAKRGRPPLANPKDYMLRVRFDGEELKLLDDCCKTLGLSRSEVARNGIEKLYRQIKR